MTYSKSFKAWVLLQLQQDVGGMLHSGNVSTLYGIATHKLGDVMA
jgi:hypothetical protein